VAIGLVLWTAALVYAYAGLRDAAGFYALAAGIAVVLGGPRRSPFLFSRMIPEGQEAEYFSSTRWGAGTSWLGRSSSAWRCSSPELPGRDPLPGGILPRRAGAAAVRRRAAGGTGGTAGHGKHTIIMNAGFLAGASSEATFATFARSLRFRSPETSTSLHTPLPRNPRVVIR